MVLPQAELELRGKAITAALDRRLVTAEAEAAALPQLAPQAPETAEMAAQAPLRLTPVLQ
jgi:hypothetical protein